MSGGILLQFNQEKDNKVSSSNNRVQEEHGHRWSCKNNLILIFSTFIHWVFTIGN